MRNSVKDDYEMPLEQLYARFPEDTKAWIRKTTLKIRLYFGMWVLFFILSAVLIWVVLSCKPTGESVHTWVQRAGTLIVLLTGVGETIFVVKLRALAQVSHWAQLSCEIYIERRYKKYLLFSLIVSALLIIVGSIVSGYGDILYQRWMLAP